MDVVRRLGLEKILDGGLSDGYWFRAVWRGTASSCLAIIRLLMGSARSSVLGKGKDV